MRASKLLAIFALCSGTSLAQLYERHCWDRTYSFNAISIVETKDADAFEVGVTGKNLGELTFLNTNDLSLQTKDMNNHATFYIFFKKSDCKIEPDLSIFCEKRAHPSKHPGSDFINFFISHEMLSYDKSIEMMTPVYASRILLKLVYKREPQEYAAELIWKGARYGSAWNHDSLLDTQSTKIAKTNNSGENLLHCESNNDWGQHDAPIFPQALKDFLNKDFLIETPYASSTSIP
jgi:hypothetical protein